MKTAYLTHIVAALTLVLGLWLFFGNSDESPDDSVAANDARNKPGLLIPQSRGSVENSTKDYLPENSSQVDAAAQLMPGEMISSDAGESTSASTNTQTTVANPGAVIDDYIAAWRNKDKAAIDQLWSVISHCEPCLVKVVDMIVNKNLEEGMMLELAIKMAALDSNTVLPVFDVIIDPAGNRSAAIILSEKIINNGRPEFVTKIFEVIYRAQQNGYDNFARQLTWVISKLDNQDGLQPILDTITGRVPTSTEFSDHVSNVFSKVVFNLPNSPAAGQIIAGYYAEANSQEQQKLWPVVSQHTDTLVYLAAYADNNGQNYDVQKYARAIAQQSDNMQAVDGLVKLHMKVEYSPDYLGDMLKDNVVKNPTFKLLHKLEDYMRDPNVPLQSRLFAADGLLAVKQNRQARYMLEKVINNSQADDAELQAYIGGRL